MAGAAEWFVSKISRRKQKDKWVKDVVLRITEKGACYLLCRYCGIDRKTAQEVVGSETITPSRRPMPEPPQITAEFSRNLLDPTQFIENGVVKPISAKIAAVA